MITWLIFHSIVKLYRNGKKKEKAYHNRRMENFPLYLNEIFRIQKW